MGWFSDDSEQAQNYNEWNSGQDYKPHEASKVHEALAGAAAYEAAKKYEEHCDREGKPQSHEKAKEIIAGLAGAFIDREVETRGYDFVDKEKAKYEARQQAHSVISEDNY